MIAICAVIAGAESWEDMAYYGRSKLSWLRQFLALPHGIPSHDTFRRVFMLIDPEAFESCFRNWVGRTVTLEPAEVVAVDGKTLRRSFDRGRDQSPLHLVSAWASEQGVILGQRCVDDKLNEITAIPELLKSLSLSDALVTLDAMGCQKAIAQPLVDRQADYLLVLKANHEHTYAAVQQYFDENCFGRPPTEQMIYDQFDGSHGRCVYRRVFVCHDLESLSALEAWPQLKTVLALESIRSVTGSAKVETQIRYFISSYDRDDQHLVRAIRRHWSIENNVHWVLDVNFREDDCRVREPTAVQNFALLRKIAMNLLTQDTSTTGSLRGKRKRAAWDDGYMLKLLGKISCVSPGCQPAHNVVTKRPPLLIYCT